MPNPSRPELVRKAICAGIFGYIQWKRAAEDRVLNDVEMKNYRPEAIRRKLRDFIVDGGTIDVRNEIREELRAEDPDNPYWYRVLLPAPELADATELFVELVLVDYDETEPWVEIVSAHPQRR